MTLTSATFGSDTSRFFTGICTVFSLILFVIGLGRIS
jgi:hypothetical protein